MNTIDCVEPVLAAFETSAADKMAKVCNILVRVLHIYTALSLGLFRATLNVFFRRGASVNAGSATRMDGSKGHNGPG